ncbi:HEAT repeat domain-containing protein (plasmid) [Leptospira sp. WS39.C2]
MKKIFYRSILFIFCFLTFSALCGNDLNSVNYQKIKEVLSNPHHQEESEVYQQRISKITDQPLPYIIALIQSKKNYTFIRARAIKMLDLYQSQESQTTLEKTIDDQKENTHIRKLAIRTYSSSLKIDGKQKHQFLKKFETHKDFGPLISHKNIDPVQKNNSKAIEFKMENERVYYPKSP